MTCSPLGMSTSTCPLVRKDIAGCPSSFGRSIPLPHSSGNDEGGVPEARKKRGGRTAKWVLQVDGVSSGHPSDVKQEADLEVRAALALLITMFCPNGQEAWLG